MTARVVSTNWHPELHIKNELVNLSMEQSNTGMIILDAKGIISSVNQKISTLFRMTPQMMCGKKLNTIIPELSELAHCFENGQALPRRKIKLNSISNSKPYYMDCQPIMKGDQRLGSVIFISDKKDTEAIVKHFITKAAHFNFNDLIGNNPDFLATKKLAKDYAQSESNLLIIGESGTGKELFAHSIHNASNRKDGPFVSINCAAIPRELLCSELFGYVEGSFTGANKAGAYGKFELAHNGTLFLDEIADMPIDMQSILLKAIEEKSFFKLGDSSPTPVDVRIIAATNKDLWQLVKEGSFRQDLYFRLNVLKLELIPLRNRPDDIPLLIDYFSKQYRNLDNQVITFAPEAMDIFFKYHWPGNVRQLRNVIERCANQNTSSTISIYDLPKEIITMQSGESILNGDNSTAKLIHGLKKELDFSEKQIIKDLMLKFKGNKSRVAEELGIARTTLYRKLKDMNWDYK